MKPRWISVKVISPLGDTIEQSYREMSFDERREKAFWSWYIHRRNNYDQAHLIKPENFPWLPENFWEKAEQLMIKGVI